jgi:hypothetical protein
MMKVYTFDDKSLGLSDNGNKIVTKSLVDKPQQMPVKEWYRFANAVCRELNLKHNQLIAVADLAKAYVEL